jgi:hypothetical protein
MKKKLLLAIFVGALSAAPANAAFITVDDTDLANITLTAGDFEFDFLVDGSLLTTGLGNSNSITLADGAAHTISGSWIDLGLSGGSLDILFALPSAPTNVTSNLRFTTSTNGSVGTLTGDFGGYTGATYFSTGLATDAQNGQTIVDGVPFLSVSMASEAPAPVPEPATLTLLGVGLAGMVARRWRQRKAS